MYGSVPVFNRKPGDANLNVASPDQLNITRKNIDADLQKVDKGKN